MIYHLQVPFYDRMQTRGMFTADTVQSTEHEVEGGSGSCELQGGQTSDASARVGDAVHGHAVYFRPMSGGLMLIVPGVRGRLSVDDNQTELDKTTEDV